MKINWKFWEKEYPFGLRITHRYLLYYVIEYREPGRKNEWKKITSWFEFSHPSRSMSGWDIKLFKVGEAEEFVEKIKSMDDIKKHYIQEHKKAEEWEIAEQKWWKENVPYETKTII